MSGARDRKSQTGSVGTREALNTGAGVMWSTQRMGQDAEAYPPPMDMYEKGDNLVIELELPGVNKQDIEVCVLSNQVTVEGIKTEAGQSREVLGKGISFLQLERKLGGFFRRIELPVPCNTREARAWYDKGVLVIEFKKIKNKRGERIRIPVE